MASSPASGARVALEIAQGADSWGQIVVELDEEQAPTTVRNFLEYVEAGFYNGTIFHRVIPTFMIQGGGHLPDFTPKQASLRQPIENEAARGRAHERGTIAMARTSAPHSATSQFFINAADNAFLNHPGQDGWGYCAFGRVVAGLELVDRIKDVATQADPNTGEASRPVEPPVIRSARRL